MVNAWFNPLDAAVALVIRSFVFKHCEYQDFFVENHVFESMIDDLNNVSSFKTITMALIEKRM
jgi:hypothetical protein